MWSVIISSVLPVLMKVVGSWVDKQILEGKLKKEAKDDFLKFVQHVDGTAHKLAKDRDSVNEQLDGFRQDNNKVS